MSVISWFRKRQAEARQRALDKARAERQNAARSLALDDFLFHGQLPAGGREDEGYRSAIGAPFEDEPESSKEDW